MRSRMTYSLIGLITGIITIVVGVVFLVNPPDFSTTKSVDRLTFGADFYTEEYSATKVAGDNVAVVADNLEIIAKTNAKYAGTFFIVSGFVLFLLYGEKIDNIRTEYKSESDKQEKKVELPSL